MNYEDVECFYKSIFLLSHLDYFREKIKMQWREQEEKFHDDNGQTILETLHPSMLGDYCQDMIIWT